MSGTTSPASRRRAIAISTRSRARSSSAGATTRSPSRLKAKAADLLDKLKNGNPLDAMAAANGVKVETATGLKRGKPPGRFRRRMIEAIFHTAKDAYASAEGDKPTQWIVFRVTDVKTPTLDANSADGKALDRLARAKSATTFSASTWRGWKTISAPASTRPCWRKPWATARRIPIECRSSLRPKHSPPAMRPASRRSCGRRWLPTWKRRSPPS